MSHRAALQLVKCRTLPMPPLVRRALSTACRVLLLLLAAGWIAATVSKQQRVGGLYPVRTPIVSSCRLSEGTVKKPPAPWVAAYERYDAVRCSRLAMEDAAEQKFVRSLVANNSASLSCYRDASIGCLPCAELRAGFRRLSDAAAEERDFPLAYGLRVHTCATQVELLLRAIYAPHNFYCIHADAKAPPEFIAAMRRLAKYLPNVRLATLDEDFVYGSESQMAAHLECMQLASQSSVRWRYFINLAGQELPLKTNFELVQMLDSLNGSSHVYMEKPANPERQANSFWCKDATYNRTVSCPHPQTAKTPVPGNLIIYKSYANAEFSRAFVEYLLDEGGFAKQLYDWFSDTYAPEEHYYATLLALPDTPGGVWRQSPTRAILWDGGGECGGRFVRDICIFVSADLPRLVAGRPEPFVNKLHFKDDPIAVLCLVEMILAREAAARTGTRVLSHSAGHVCLSRSACSLM